jgi:hypothetical protein
MPASAEPLRRLPVPARPIARETIGSFLTRLAFANRLRVPHLLALAAITTDTRAFSPATDDTRGWSESTPGRIAALAGRPLPELAAAIPLLAAMTPAGTAPLRACGHCTAAKNVTGMVIILGRARDYVCLRHQQWLRGIYRPGLAALPEVTESQRRHDRRTMDVPDQDIARAHRQAMDITGQWPASRAHRTLAGQAPPPGRRNPRAGNRPHRRDHPPRDARGRPPADQRPPLSGHPATGDNPTARFLLPQQPAPARPAPEPPVPVSQHHRLSQLIRTAHGPFAVRLPAEEACGGGTVEQGVLGLALEAGGVADGGEPCGHDEARLGGSDVGRAGRGRRSRGLLAGFVPPPRRLALRDKVFGPNP